MELNNYNSTQRKIEALAILVYLTLLGYTLYLLIPFILNHPIITIFAIVAGMILADLATGIIHWAGDTWGTPTWPIVGNAFIRPFREHHIDQKAITKHDFIETNGSNSIFSLPFVLLALLFTDIYTGPIAATITLIFLSTALFGFGTNQFHKWSHQDNPPKLVQLLQKTRIILPKNHHTIHHTAPFEHHYAITNGWTNPITKKLHFYRALEWIITKTTGAIPRKSDQEIILHTNRK